MRSGRPKTVKKSFQKSCLSACSRVATAQSRANRVARSVMAFHERFGIGCYLSGVADCDTAYPLQYAWSEEDADQRYGLGSNSDSPRTGFGG